MNSLWLLMLPVAATFGYVSATRKRVHEDKARQRLSRNYYLVGLNFLLNDESDKAISSFIKMLEVDSDTVETHLALGSLFRRRGEVNRAIRIHQNLIANQNLKHEFRAEALFALAKDYLSAGMLDRAERLFLELLEQDSHTKASCKALLYVYQQEKDWLKAIDLAQKFADSNQEMKIALAHYHCEQAENYLRAKELEKALRFLRKALMVNPQCARARLCLADLQITRGNYRAASRYLKYIREKTPQWLLLAIPKLQDTYLALQRSDAFITYLQEVLQSFPTMPILTILAEQIRQQHGDQAALHFVTQYVREYPTLTGLQHLLNLQVSMHQTEHHEHWQMINELMRKLAKENTGYQCGSCGYASRILHWNCPSCRRWETIKPNYL